MPGLLDDTCREFPAPLTSPLVQCRFIFRAKELDLGRLASALGLLRLPRMPELRGAAGTAAFVPSAVDPATVKVRSCHSAGCATRTPLPLIYACCDHSHQAHMPNLQSYPAYSASCARERPFCDCACGKLIRGWLTPLPQPICYPFVLPSRGFAHTFVGARGGSPTTSCRRSCAIRSCRPPLSSIRSAQVLRGVFRDECSPQPVRPVSATPL